MRVIVTRYGASEVLAAIEEPISAPEPGQIRVKVHSAGVALADIMRREGKYPASPTPPFTPGYDAVGLVDALGEGVGNYTVGDPVAVFFNGTGGYAAYIYPQYEEIFPIPQDLDPALAVAAVLNYVSAYQMLHRLAQVSEGERILIHGASGGVGTALLDLGRLAKLEMYGTASPTKHGLVSQFGATPIDYRHDDFVEVIHRRVPTGLDVVFDPIGGTNYERSLQTLGPHGRFVAYGYTSVLQGGSAQEWAANWDTLAQTPTSRNGRPMLLYSVTALKRDRLEWFREDAQAVLGLLAYGKIQPVISHRIPLRNAAQAHDLLQKSLATGKVVLIND